MFKIGKIFRYIHKKYRNIVVKMNLYELDLQHYHERDNFLSTEGAFQTIDIATLGKLAEQIPPDRYSMFEDRLRDYNDTMVVFITGEGTLIHWAWITYRNSYFEPDVEQEIVIPQDTGLLYDMQTIAISHRKMGIYESSIRNSLRLIKEKGKRKALGATLADNIAPNKVLSKLGFVIVSKFTLLKLGPVRIRRHTTARDLSAGRSQFQII